MGRRWKPIDEEGGDLVNLEDAPGSEQIQDSAEDIEHVDVAPLSTNIWEQAVLDLLMEWLYISLYFWLYKIVTLDFFWNIKLFFFPLSHWFANFECLSYICIGVLAKYVVVKYNVCWIDDGELIDSMTNVCYNVFLY